MISGILITNREERKDEKVTGSSQVFLLHFPTIFTVHDFLVWAIYLGEGSSTLISFTHLMLNDHCSSTLSALSDFGENGLWSIFI